VSSCDRALSASDAAQQLGVSIKTLRVYEQRGLITPQRTAAGYRVYGPDEMRRAAEIISLRALGLSLRQVAQVLEGDPQGLELALAAHEAMLRGEMRRLAQTIENVRGVRAGLTRGQVPASGELVRLLQPSAELNVSFELPWPWGGERFELNDVRAINYIVGPLGCGKTRLAQRLAETLPGAAFVSLERLQEGGTVAAARVASDPALKSRVDQNLAWLVDEGAVASNALVALLVGLEAEGPAVLVVER
jgi:DNA-binding transcriptional MerR regulator